jgi:hypothetical protein
LVCAGLENIAMKSKNEIFSSTCKEKW